MNLIFMGTGRFALPCLRALLDSPQHKVDALFTQPDKPAGRGHALRTPPTKPIALDRSIPVHQPRRVRTSECVELIQRLAPDCIVVAAYGQIIPKSILDIPPRGIINVHGSLLPA
ncbi:MAG: methionyl-tRNA formyltransferase, partial [Acidobacteriota bacterium]